MRDERDDPEVEGQASEAHEAEEKEQKPTITRGSTEGGRRRPRSAAPEADPVEGWPKRSSRPRSANVRHTQRGRFSVVGASGTRYAFGSHGTLKVKGEDVEALLAIKRVQRTCCGPRAPQVLYPLVLA